MGVESLIMDSLRRDGFKSVRASKKFSKLGDALRYGFTKELVSTIRHESDSGMLHLNASFIYMALYNIVDAKKLTMISRIVLLGLGDESSIPIIVKSVSESLFSELKSKYEFKNFDELKNILNQYSIPDWCFCFADDISSLILEDLVLYNEDLYFVGAKNTESETSLYRINTLKLRSHTKLINNEGIEEVGNGFNKLLGFDRKLLRIYLGLYNQKNFYAYYDMLNDCVAICRNRFHSFVDDNLFVVTRDYYLAVVIGDTEHRIREFKDNEEYVVKEGYFLVKPSEIEGRFFEPFRLYFDGRVLPAEKDDYDSILWRYITKSIGNVDRVPYSYSKSNKDRIEKPSKLSIEKINETLEVSIPRENRCRDKNYIVFKNILDVIEKYVDKKTDLSKTLYALCEAHTVLAPTDKDFPSDILYWRIKEVERNIENSDNVISVLLKNYNYEKLVEELCNNPIPVNNSSNNPTASRSFFDGTPGTRAETDKNQPSKIGTFMVLGDTVQSHVVSIEEGMFLGNQIVPKTNYYNESGFVTFDAKTGFSYITCEHDITSDAKLCILKDYSIDPKRVRVIKQGKPDEEIKRINRKYSSKELCEESTDQEEYYEENDSKEEFDIERLFEEESWRQFGRLILEDMDDED